jgi:HEAT repeat protein
MTKERSRKPEFDPYSRLSSYYGMDTEMESALAKLGSEERGRVEHYLRVVERMAQTAEVAIGWAESPSFGHSSLYGHDDICNWLRGLHYPIIKLAREAVGSVLVPKHSNEEKPWNTLDLKDIGAPVRRKALDFLMEFMNALNKVKRASHDLVKEVEAQLLKGLKDKDPDVRKDAAKAVALVLGERALKSLKTALETETDVEVKEHLTKQIGRWEVQEI